MTDLIRLSRGLWRPDDQIDDLLSRCAALLSILPPDSVIGGETAGLLHGMWLPCESVRRIEVLLCNDDLRPRERAGSIRDEIVGRRRTVQPDEVVWLDGVPVTSETRTWVDLGERLELPDLVAAGDSVLRGGAGDDLDEMIRRAAGRRGVRKVRAARPFLSERSRSRPESHLRYGLVVRGLPEPEVNVAVHNDRGEWVGEPDLHYRRARLALEYNGVDHENVRRMRNDITRTLDFAAEGWLTLAFGPVQVFQRMDQTFHVVRRELDARDPGWRTRVAS